MALNRMAGSCVLFPLGTRTVLVRPVDAHHFDNSGIKLQSHGELRMQVDQHFGLEVPLGDDGSYQHRRTAHDGWRSVVDCVGDEIGG